MTAEERARAFKERWWRIGSGWNPSMDEADLAASLRAAESSALERAAQIAEANSSNYNEAKAEIADGIADAIRALIPPAAAPDKPPGLHPNNPVGPERSIPERGRSSGGAPSHSTPGDVRCEKCGGWRFEPWVLQCQCAPAAETGKAQGAEARVPEAWVEATRNAIADYLESDAVTEKYWKHSGALADLAAEIRKMHVTADVSAKLAARVAPPEGEGK